MRRWLFPVILPQYIYLDESVIDDYKLRTELFSHVANVLQMVDSKGANWRQRLESLRKEEEEKLAKEAQEAEDRKKKGKNCQMKKGKRDDDKGGEGASPIPIWTSLRIL